MINDDDDRSSCDIVDGIAGAERAGTNKNTAIVTTQHVCSVERARERERFWKDVATGWLRTVSSCFQRRCSQIRSTVRSFRAAESPALCTTVCATIHGPWHTSAAKADHAHRSRRTDTHKICDHVIYMVKMSWMGSYYTIDPESSLASCCAVQRRLRGLLVHTYICTRG